MSRADSGSTNEIVVAVLFGIVRTLVVVLLLVSKVAVEVEQ